jgi:hypothetical protein
VLDT